MRQWKTIKDDNVRHIWKCEESDCDFNNPQVEISPDFYQDNGEPVCSCDRLMTYIHTEIK